MRSHRRTLAAAFTALAATACAPAHARDYYVSPSGSDSAAGTSPSAPWRSVNKANAAPLAPGDSVAFLGGASFSGLVAPIRSGSASAPITYKSYGSGKATLPGGVWMKNVANLVFQDLKLDGSTKGFASTPQGSGVDNITFLRNETRNHTWAYHAHPLDDNWVIRDCVIDRIGTSGVYTQANGVRVQNCRISNVGLAYNSGYHYPHHGIYSKGPALTAIGNEISNIHGAPDSQGISIRFRNNLIEGNYIHDVPFGIAYFREDGSTGTTTIRRNRFARLSRLVFYVGAGNGVSGVGDNFYVYNNTAVTSPAGQPAFNWAATGGRELVFRNNALQGFSTLFSKTGATQSHNLLGSVNVDSAFRPNPGSPLINAGTAAIRPGVALSSTCNGGALSYCGSAPDIGAVEAG